MIANVVLEGTAAQIEAELSAEFGMIITGLGRSGTTFLAHLFLQAGYDLGDVQADGIGVDAPSGGGLEYLPFCVANMQLQLHVLRNTHDALGEDGIMRIAKCYQHEMVRHWPEVLKDPRYLDTHVFWHRCGLVPKHVFLCLRPQDERSRSLAALYERAGEVEKEYICKTHDTFYCYYSVFNLLVYCQMHDIPHTIVLYPRIGVDREYAERTLGPFVDDVWSVIRRTWDPTLLHYTKFPDA